MLVSVPRPQMPVALEPDGVRRLAGAQRQPQPSRLIAVLERSAFIRDVHGKKQQYVPFAERIVKEKHLAQRSTHGLHFDFALTLCDFVNRPLLTLTGTAVNGELTRPSCRLSRSTPVPAKSRSRHRSTCWSRTMTISDWQNYR